MKALINKFFSKKEEITNISVEVLEQPTVKPKTKEYPKIVQEIHEEILRNDSIDEEPDTREGISKQDRDFDEDI